MYQKYRKKQRLNVLVMSQEGISLDNACIESFHAIIKREWLNRFTSVISFMPINWYLNIWKLFITQYVSIAIAIICLQVISKNCTKDVEKDLCFISKQQCTFSHFILY